MPRYRPLRVLQVSEPNKNGVFIHVRGLLQHLLKQGHKVTYAYSSRRSSSQLDELLGEIHLVGAQSRDMRIENRPSVADIRELGWLMWSISQNRPDVVHGHSSKAGALVRLVAWLLPQPAYVYTPHAYYSMSARPAGGGIVYWWIERLLGHTAVTINISKDERRFAVNSLALGRAPAVIAANPVDLKRFIPATSERKRETRRQLGIPENKIVFGFLARFGEQKDPGTFYTAAIAAAKENSSLHFCHLGTGSGAAYYQDQVVQTGVADQFTLIPYLADPSPFYAALDAFVVTSLFEAGWPIVMLEALASGLPFVSTDFVGLGANNISDLSAAWVSPAGNVDDLQQRFDEAAQVIESGRIENNHRAYMEKHFAPHACYGKVEALYLQISAFGTVIV